MNAKPHSVSWSEDIDKIIRSRMAQERMSLSEYFRKCVREEWQRTKASRVALLAEAMDA